MEYYVTNHNDIVEYIIMLIIITAAVPNEGLLCDKHYSKHFTCLKPFNPQNSLRR